ncbi:MAG: serine/threonine-protein kinase [Luteolibacter sp.]
MSPSQFEVPEIAALLTAFEIEHLISTSEMGAIFKARQISLDRDVAIKVLSTNDPLIRSSFEAQAKAMASLTHTNLIRVFDSGKVNRLLYMVMEYVPGNSLRNSAHGKAIDPQQAAEIIIAACEGLAHAHENGIAHRNISPSSILLTSDAKPKIGDLGFNAYSDEAETSAYLAPEFASHPEQGNAPSDIFAIGMILRELLTGAPADTEEFQTTPIPDGKLATICRKATHEDPAERFQDITSLSDALNSWNCEKPFRKLATSRPPSYQRPSLAKKPAKYVAKAPSLRCALLRNCAIIVALLCAIQLVWILYQNKQETLARLQMEQDSKHPTFRIVYLDTETATNHSSSGLSSTALAATGMD